MDPSDSSQNRKRIPSVSDVVSELSKRLLASPEQQPALFHAAQQACSEELRLVRTGFGPAGFEELVERAIRLLPAELAGEGSPRWSEANAFPESEPFRDAPPSASPVSSGQDEGPFAFESDGVAESTEGLPEPARRLEIPDAPPERPDFRAEPAPVARMDSPAVVSYRSSAHERPRHRRSASISAFRALIFLIILGVGAGAYWWIIRGRGLSFGAAAGIAGTPVSRTVPAKPKAESAPVEPPAAPPEAAAAPPQAAAVPGLPVPAAVPSIPESKGSSMVSEDWDGRTPVFMIHFSSYQKRENAERDQARLAKLVGRPFHIISVNLGREGPWFRVMLGDFPSREEALTFRQQLADRNTAGMGLVYRVSGAHARASSPAG